MEGYYQITETLKESLTNVGFRNVTIGDIGKVNTKKQNIFPLAHIIPEPVTTSNNINTFSFTIVGMDVVDFRKTDPKDETEMFYGIDNLQDVHHDVLFKMQTAIEEFRRGDKFQELTQVLDDQIYDPFERRFENVLAGWSVGVSIQAPKYTTIC